MPLLTKLLPTETFATTEADPDYCRCQRCVMDTTAPGITFDAQGICSFCAVHDRMDARFPLGEAGLRTVRQLAAQMRRAGHGKRYDCVLGVSGGRDSTYAVWYCVTQLKLRPLAVHFNDGFGNPVAGENMVRTCQRLNVELRTITSDWRESFGGKKFSKQRHQ